MKREIIKTGDGSKTIRIVDWNEQYHSVHGAINEAVHVYIEAGLKFLISADPTKKTIKLLEIGFGTGLNAFLTAVKIAGSDIKVEYTGIEGYPVQEEEILQLNYPELIGGNDDIFHKIHQATWSEKTEITNNFSLEKIECYFSEIDFVNQFDLIYFDAFGPRVQPELWSEQQFLKMFKALKSNGTLVTYSSKGDVRRAMVAAGLKVEKIPGPPGKREMVRALKLP